MFIAHARVPTPTVIRTRVLVIRTHVWSYETEYDRGLATEGTECTEGGLQWIDTMLRGMRSMIKRINGLPALHALSALCGK